MSALNGSTTQLVHKSKNLLYMEVRALHICMAKSGPQRKRGRNQLSRRNKNDNNSTEPISPAKLGHTKKGSRKVEAAPAQVDAAPVELQENIYRLRVLPLALTKA